MPKVSVIIPSFNCELYIAETITSVLNQTHPDIELIVVDDGSTDRTREIVASFGSSVRLIAQQNSGRCAARNRGIRAATGEFICLLDHDDYWYPKKVAAQLAVFERYPEAGGVYSGYLPWHADVDGRYPAPETIDRTAELDEVNEELSGWIYHHFLIDIYMLTSAAMFRAEVFDKCGAFVESLSYSEDWELWLRISREFQLISLRRPMTLYRQHPEQGFRVMRDFDYRTDLLERTAQKWGLCSRDGRCVTRKQFRNQLATYHISFALGHLQSGKRSIAIHSFFKAWLVCPLKLKALAYIPAALLGWKPNY
ncbi:MAG: glycosyltransferase [Gallionella sp.]|nr:glycosyltransferase [Gallionella sp.]MDD4945571.1 glycosyltransferase [Gallionella sp.]MDD5611582.1 glycosyltransferase [Gallionella sp.]